MKIFIFNSIMFILNLSFHASGQSDDIRLDCISMRLIKLSPINNELKGKAFYLQNTEVTNEQFKIFLKETGGKKVDSITSKVKKRNSEDLYWIENDFPAGKGSHPVVLVSPSECDNFCQWLKNRSPGLKGLFRLPTKEEWIFAAYGGVRAYPWGNENKDNTYYLNDLQESLLGNEKQQVKTTNSVKAFTLGQTPEGIFGLWGNVNEFVATPNKDGNGWLTQPYWLGGSFSSKERFEAKQSYWGYAHSTDYKDVDVGFRVVYIEE